MEELVAAPYMLTFRCLGGDCEDTCCAAWDVPISPEDHQRLTAVIGPAADAMVKRIPDGSGGSLVVLAKREADTRCTQLDAAGWCSLHAKHGEAVLPEICCAYPRFIGKVADRLELTGHMSCPEVVRQCLLGAAPDVLVPATPEPFGRFQVGFEVTPDDEVPYLTPFVHIRAALLAACGNRTLPIATRLFAIAAFGDRVGSFYHREATAHEPERLVAELACLDDPEHLAALHDLLTAQRLDGRALTAVMGMIQSRLSASPAFSRVVGAIARHLGEAAGVPDPGDPWKQLMAIGPARILAAYTERKTALSARQAERLEHYFERYATNYWLQDWYPLSPTLFEHSMQLLLRVALIRFLLLVHPDFTPAADEAQLDRAAVDVFYATARAYDHNQGVRAALSLTLTKRNMLDMTHAAAFLKV